MRKSFLFQAIFFFAATSAWGATFTLDFSGGIPSTWQTTGAVTGAGEATVDLADGTAWYFDAANGMAQLTSQGTDVVSLDTFLGLTTPGNTIEDYTYVAWGGSAMKTSFTVDASQAAAPIDIWFAFATTDFPSSATAFATLMGPTLTSSFTVLACGDLTCNSPALAQGWTDYSFTPGSAGTYTLGFGIVKPFDGLPDSLLFVNGAMGEAGPVPEPATLGLIGGGLASLLILRRRRG